MNAPGLGGWGKCVSRFSYGKGCSKVFWPFRSWSSLNRDVTRSQSSTMAFIFLPTHYKNTEDTASQGLLCARGPKDLQPVVRLFQSCKFTAVVMRTQDKECDLMQRHGLLMWSISSPSSVLPQSNSLKELQELVSDELRYFRTVQAAEAPASPKPAWVRQHPLCSHLPKTTVFTVCCPEPPPPPHCTWTLPVPPSQPAHLSTLHGLGRVLKVTYSTNLSFISFSSPLVS